jgi:hypothetical protein
MPHVGVAATRVVLTETANRRNPEAPFHPEYQRGEHEPPNG